MIGEGMALTTVHFIAVDTGFCGRLLSAKTFLRLASGPGPLGRLFEAAGMKMIGGGYVG